MKVKKERLFGALFLIGFVCVFFVLFCVISWLLPKAMRVFISAKLILLAAVLTTAQTTNSSQVDELMAQWSKGATPGAAIIVIKDGEVIHKKGYGMADLEARTPITANTVFDTASVSKQFTAMAVMILAERGKLSYSDPLSKYFPEFPAYAQQITIRHLLNHTSGLADFTIYWKDGQRLNKDTAKHTPDDVLKFLAERKKPEFPAGDKWLYSNSGYVLLTMIVGKVSGTPFPQFVKENIFAPLGMNDSFVYDESKRQAPNRALGYVLNGGGFKRADDNPNNFVVGDGRLLSTVEDMAKWDQALNTEKLVKAATLKEAFTSGTLNDGTKFNYGFGWAMGKYLGLPFISHSGGTDGFIAHIARFPAQKFTVVLLSNFEQITASYLLANKIARIYLGDKLLPPAMISSPKNLKDHAGNYAFYNIAIKVTVENDALWVTSPGKKAKLIPVGDDEFIVEGSNGETAYEFKRNAGGIVTGVSLLSVNGLFLSKQP